MLRAKPTCYLSIADGGIDFYIDDAHTESAPHLFHASVDSAQGVESLRLALQQLLTQIEASGLLKIAPRRFGKQGLCISLSNDWTEQVEVPWNPMAADGSSLQQYAKSCLQQAGVEVFDNDVVRVTDGDFQEARSAVCYSHALLSALNEFSATLNLRVLRVSSLGFDAAMSMMPALSSKAIIAVLSASGISFWGGRRTAISYLAHWRYSALNQSVIADSVMTGWRRLQFRNPVYADSAEIYYMDLRPGTDSEAMPASVFLKKLEFGVKSDVTSALPSALRVMLHAKKFPSVISPVRHWWRFTAHQYLACAGLLVLLGLQLVDVFGLYQQRLFIAERIARESISQVPATVVTLSAEQKKRVPSVNTAIRELNMPIAALLKAIRPPQDLKVAIMGVEFSPGASASERPSLKLLGEAKTMDDMLRYSANLTSSLPIKDSYLLSHEISESDPLKVVRFKLEARWAE